MTQLEICNVNMCLQFVQFQFINIFFVTFKVPKKYFIIKILNLFDHLYAWLIMFQNQLL